MTASALVSLKLAERYGLEKSTVSRQLSQLEEDGLLHRVAHPSRPRTKLLELTDTGRARLARQAAPAQGA